MRHATETSKGSDAQRYVRDRTHRVMEVHKVTFTNDPFVQETIQKLLYGKRQCVRPKMTFASTLHFDFIFKGSEK